MPCLKEEIEHSGSYVAPLVKGEMDSRLGDIPKGQPYLLKKYGGTNGFDYPELSDLVHNMRTFHTITGSLGVPTAQPYGYYVQQNGNPQRFTLVEAVPQLGQDLKVILSAPETTQKEAMRLIDQYLAMHSRVWNAGFPASLDPALANYCIDEEGYIVRKGDLVFIDPMPPRRQWEGGGSRRSIVEWPNPTEDVDFHYGRHFTPAQGKVIFGQIMRQVIHKGISLDTIKARMREHLGETAIAHLDIPLPERRRLLEQPEPTDLDTVRVAAFHAHQHGHIQAPHIAQIYDLTHIDAGGKLPPSGRIRRATEMLQKHFQA